MFPVCLLGAEIKRINYKWPFLEKTCHVQEPADLQESLNNELISYNYNSI